MSRSFTLLFIGALFVLGCTQQPSDVIEIKHYPMDSTEGVISKTDLHLDRSISSDGNGSLRATVTKPTVLRLFETGDIDIENAQLIYRAKIKTENIEGSVYLEMWCSFTGKGEFFSRALQSPISGSMDWSTQETPFFLQKGQNPDNVKLNLVVNGTGSVWIDDILLLKGSLM
ncbi:MAG: hypothetical protein V3V59_03645 [Thermodesulfovibrionales bacterium]